MNEQQRLRNEINRLIVAEIKRRKQVQAQANG